MNVTPQQLSCYLILMMLLLLLFSMIAAAVQNCPSHMQILEVFLLIVDEDDVLELFRHLS
jgi:hypothetical protein